MRFGLLEVRGLDRRTEIIKEMIEKRWPTQKAFAEAANIPYTTLRSILERGVGKSAVENVIKICRTLGIKIEDLEEMAQSDREVEKTHTDLTEEEILTLAAHSAGHEGKLTEEQLAKIKLAVKIALAKDD
jgi:predicted transcriptional regulator